MRTIVPARPLRRDQPESRAAGTDQRSAPRLNSSCHLRCPTIPHVCIGNHVAMMEAQLVLATFVQRVTCALVPEPLITLQPKSGTRTVGWRDLS